MKSFKLVRCLVAGALIAAAQLSHAAYLDVSQIVITSSNPGTVGGWIQISEVFAYDAGAVDQALAATATATGTGNYQGGPSSPDFAIDGVGPAAYASMYHSDTRNLGESLTIDFNAPFVMDSLSITGRTDSHSQRDVWDVQVFNSGGKLIAQAMDQSANNSGHIVNVSLTTVPIPAAAWLFGSALLGLGALKRRKA